MAGWHNGRMSIEKELHKAHVAILHCLLFKPDARFAQLQKASGLSSDHFNFYLKQLVESGLVSKNTANAYHLSPAGKEFANRFDTDERKVERQPKVAVCLMIERPDGKLLVQQRLKQPYYGYWGRPTGKIRWGETVLQAAARELKEETGLEADFAYDAVYHKQDINQATGELLEDKIFFMVRVTNVRGAMIQEFEGGRNAWKTPAEYSSEPLSFESNDIIDLDNEVKVPIVEARHQYSPDHY